MDARADRSWESSNHIADMLLGTSLQSEQRVAGSKYQLVPSVWQVVPDSPPRAPAVGGLRDKEGARAEGLSNSITGRQNKGKDSESQEPKEAEQTPHASCPSVSNADGR